jgi:hypothetical protein
MAYTKGLTIGPVHSILQNVVYALPARNVRVLAGAAVEVSLDGTNFTALTGSALTTGVETSAAFVRCTTGNTSIILKAT